LAKNRDLCHGRGDVRSARRSRAIDIWDTNEIGPDTLVDGIIQVSLAPVDPNEQIKRIVLLWCDQQMQDCRIITIVEDPNGAPLDVNTANPWIYQVNSYLYQNGPSRLVALTWDMFENAKPNTIDFFNFSSVSNFHVDPELVTAHHDHIDVGAALSQSSDWSLEIRDPNDLVVAESNEDESWRVDETFTVDSGWEDGTYVADLTVGALDVNTTFVVARGDPVAQISNLDDDADLDDTDRGPLPIVKEGLFELTGAAYHPAAPRVQYKVQLFKPQVDSYTLESWNSLPQYFVETVTPGADANDWALISVEPTGSLGTLDLTGMENGTYQMLLTVGHAGSFAYANVGFVLDTPLKIGNVRFTQQDMVIDVSGIPLTVTRTYDSLDRGREGDFGHGWSYSFAEMNVKLEERRTEMESQMGYGDQMVRNTPNFDRNVTLTLPDGRRATFVFYLKQVRCDGIAGELAGYTSLWCHQAKYAAPPGVAETLETLEPELMSPFGYWSNIERIGGAPAWPDYYDFSGFILTAEDGSEYYIKREPLGQSSYYDSVNKMYIGTTPYDEPYLDYIKTPAGEKIEITSGKIEHYDAEGTPTKSINIERNADGLIKAVRGPSEYDTNEPATLEYYYDDANNLTEVHRLVDRDAGDHNDMYEIVRYFYDPNRYEHYISDINDPRGLTPIRYIYDDGRLVKVIDAKGNEIELAHNVNADGGTETIYDQRGYATTYAYNQRGNITAIINALGDTTLYEYADQPRGRPGQWNYYAGNPDKPTSITDALGNRTDYEYDEDPAVGRVSGTTTPATPISRPVSPMPWAIGPITNTTRTAGLKRSPTPKVTSPKTTTTATATLG
jgi:YD repeat-containing protein